MTNESERPQAASLGIKPEFIKSQFEQAIETYRAQFSLLMQIITVLVIADVTVVGYAISTQIAGVLLIGALFPLMMLYILYTVDRLMLPIVYTAVSLEHKYGGIDADWLASTFLSTAISVEYVDTLKTISSVQDSAERTRRLRDVATPLVGMGSGRGINRITLILIALGQVVASIILSLVFKWRLF